VPARKFGDFYLWLIIKNKECACSRNVSSSGKKVGTSVSRQKESTLKETRAVIVLNLIKHFQKIRVIPVIFRPPPSYDDW
jgi:hypothetical protein